MSHRLLDSIELISFGKFRNKHFPLSDVTLFYGENEAGKTTLFDAFFQELCRPSAIKRNARYLRNRYGDKRLARLLFAEEEIVYEEDLFLNLFALRSKDISLELRDVASPSGELRDRLFTGGIDSSKLANHFEKLASEKGTLSHNKEYSKLLAACRSAVIEKEGLERKRGAFLNEMQGLEKEREELLSVKREIILKRKRIRALEHQLELWERVEEKKRMMTAIAGLESDVLRQSRIKDLELRYGEGPEELIALEALLLEAKQSVAGLKERLDSETASYDRKKQYIFDQKAFRDRQITISGSAETFIREAAAFIENPPFRKIIRWRPGFLLSALIFLLAGGAGWVLLSSFIWKISAGASAFVAAVIFIFSGRRIQIEREIHREDKILNKISKEWEKLGNPPLNPLSLVDLVAKLQKAKGVMDLVDSRISDAEEEVYNLQSSIQSLKQMTESKEKEIVRLEKEHLNWCLDHRISGKDELIKISSEIESLKKARLDWNENLSALYCQYGTMTPEELKKHLESRLKILDRDPGISSKGGDVPKLRKIYSEELSLLERLNIKYNSLNESVSRERGRISEALTNLSAEILRFEKIDIEHSIRLEQLKSDREAAAIASQIFHAISRESSEGFASLSLELAADFSKIIPGLQSVEVPELDTGKILITDKAGEKRLLENLSAGTKDSFFLAARLLLARKSGARILLFDDPFSTLDKNRLVRTLFMIKKFQEETGIQLIFFTKEKSLALLIKKRFPATVLHRL